MQRQLSHKGVQQIFKKKYLALRLHTMFLEISSRSQGVTLLDFAEQRLMQFSQLLFQRIQGMSSNEEILRSIT